MNRLRSSIGAALFAALAWFMAAVPAVAQGAYGKVQQPWYMQGKISAGISVGASSVATQLPAAGQIAAICNTGAVDASLAFGVDNTVTVVLATGTTLKAGSCRAYDLLPFSTLFKWVATISASSTTLTVETGVGTPNFQISGASTITAAAGAFAAGSAVDGWDLTQGTKADSVWTGTGSGSVVAILKAIYAGTQSSVTISNSITNPTSTLTLPAPTTAYTANQLIATSATAGSVVNPSFAIATSAGGAAIPRVRLSVNDATSTAWAGQTVQVDLWTVTPTWTNGDRGTWTPATGSTAHLASYVCVFPTPVWGDGSAAECAVAPGNFAGVRLASGTSIFWSLKAVTGSGVTGASKVWTLVPELMN